MRLPRKASVAPSLRRYGKNGADADVDVYIGRTVQGIEKYDIAAVGAVFGNDQRLFQLLRAQGADGSAGAHPVYQGLVGELVQFLHPLALHVDFAGTAQNIHQPRLLHIAGNNFGRYDKIVQQ